AHGSSLWRRAGRRAIPQHAAKLCDFPRAGRRYLSALGGGPVAGGGASAAVRQGRPAVVAGPGLASARGGQPSHVLERGAYGAAAADELDGTNLHAAPRRRQLRARWVHSLLLVRWH